MNQAIGNSTEVKESNPNTTNKIRVEDKYLVVGAAALLPAYCVKTNVPIHKEDFQQKNLVWLRPVLSLILLLSGIGLIFIRMFRKNCLIEFGLSPAVQKRYRNRRKFKVLTTAFLLIAILVAALIFESPEVWIGAMTLFAVSFVSLFFGNSPLSIAKYRKGEYWIAGCSEEFLARVDKPNEIDLPVDKQKVTQLAKTHRQYVMSMIIAFIPMVTVIAATAMTVATDYEWPFAINPNSNLLTAVLLWQLAVCILVVTKMFQICRILNEPLAFFWMLFISLIAPVVFPVYLLAVNSAAIKELKNAGFKVGFLGIAPSKTFTSA